MPYKPERISIPKIKVGKYMLNEYEFRYLQLQISKGKVDPIGITFQDHNGHTGTFNSEGIPSYSPMALSVGSQLTLALIRNNRKT